LPLRAERLAHQLPLCKTQGSHSAAAAAAAAAAAVAAIAAIDAAACSQVAHLLNDCPAYHHVCDGGVLQEVHLQLELQQHTKTCR
jgi:hypothetical protein